MNKADLVAEVAKVVGSKSCAEKAVTCILETTKKAMKKGQSVTLVGFGTFSVGRRKARVGRNPQTGKEIKIPARKVAKFAPGKAFRDALR